MNKFRCKSPRAQSTFRFPVTRIRVSIRCETGPARTGLKHPFSKKEIAK